MLHTSRRIMRTAQLNVTILLMMTLALIAATHFAVPFHYKLGCVLINCLSAALALGLWMRVIPFATDHREIRYRTASFVAWSCACVLLAGYAVGVLVIST